MSIGEAQLQSPEVAPRPPADYARRIHDQFLIPGPLTNGYEGELFDAAVRGVAERTTSPDGQRALELSAQVLDWQFFAPYGTPPPETVVVAHDPILVGSVQDRLSLKFNPTTLLDHASLQTIKEMLESEDAYQWFIESRQSRLESGTKEINQIFTEAFQETATYRFLASFDAPAQQTIHEKERQLTPYEKQVRAAQIESNVRDAYAIPRPATLSRGTPAGEILGRALFALDDETRADQTSQKSYDALEHTRNYFANCLEDAMRDHPIYGDRFDRITHITHDKIYWNGGNITLNDAASHFANNYVNERGPELPRWREVQLIKNYLVHLYGSEMENPGEVLQAAVANTLDEWHEDLRSAANSLMVERFNADNLLHFKRPDAQLYDYNWLLDHPEAPGLKYKGEYHDQISVTTAESLRAQRSIKVGAIEGLGHLRLPDTGLRLIQTRTPEEFLPPLDNRKGQLRLRFDKRNFNEGNVPEIPGYLLAGYDAETNTFGFVRDPEGDPYDVPHIPLPDNRVQALVTSYEKLGLQEMADQLRERSDWGVAELAELIKTNSRYTFRKLDDHSWNRRIREFNDFADFIQDGVPHFQCDGAQMFLKLSLDVAGNRELGVAVVDGLTMKRSDRRITALRHAQTRVTYEGQTHFVDATPSRVAPEHQHEAVVADGPRSFSLLGLLKFRPIRAGKPTEEAHLDDLASVSEMTDGPEADIAPESTEWDEALQAAQAKLAREQALRRNAEALEEQLTVALNLGNPDELYQAAQKLPDHDPIRKALRLSRRAATGTLQPEEAQAVRDDLALYVDAADNPAKAAILRKHSLGRYDKRFLAHLLNEVGRFRAAFED